MGNDHHLHAYRSGYKLDLTEKQIRQTGYGHRPWPVFHQNELLRGKTRSILVKRLFSLAGEVQVQLLVFLLNTLILHIFPYYILACMFSHARYEISLFQNLPHKTFFTSGCSTNMQNITELS